MTCAEDIFKGTVLWHMLWLLGQAELELNWSFQECRSTQRPPREGQVGGYGKFEIWVWSLWGWQPESNWTQSSRHVLMIIHDRPDQQEQMQGHLQDMDVLKHTQRTLERHASQKNCLDGHPGHDLRGFTWVIHQKHPRVIGIRHLIRKPVSLVNLAM